MDLTNICRTCLGAKYLVPIFEDSGHNSNYSGALISLTGLQFHPQDGLPQKICCECVELINKTIQFKETAISTESQLIHYKNSTEIQPETIFTDELFKSDDLKSESNDEDEIPLRYLTNSNNVDYDEIKIEKCEKQEITTNNKAKNTNHLKQQATESKLNSERVTKKMSVPHTNVSKVTCQICSAELSPKKYDTHIAIKHPERDKRLELCVLCNKYILTQRKKNHVTCVHENNFNKCFYCKKEFKQINNLAKHVKKCSQIKKREKQITRTPRPANRQLVECDVCHKKMQRNSLNYHKKIKHAGLGPVCEHCGVKFANKLRLDEHCRAKHGYEKYKCHHCEFQCSGAVALKNHERRRHLDEKPYVCETCGAKFHASYLLTQHKQSHRTERDVKCDLCPAAFKTNNSLHMHKSTCHSKKTFQCPMCPRTYPCRHYTVKHLRHTHRYKGEVPPLLTVQM